MSYYSEIFTEGDMGGNLYNVTYDYESNGYTYSYKGNIHDLFDKGFLIGEDIYRGHDKDFPTEDY